MSITRAVYDGRDRVGSIEERDDGHVVRDNLNRIIGIYKSQREAMHAIDAAAERAAS
jgi:hypothetical protein